MSKFNSETHPSNGFGERTVRVGASKKAAIQLPLIWIVGPSITARQMNSPDSPLYDDDRVNANRHESKR